MSAAAQAFEAGVILAEQKFYHNALRYIFGMIIGGSIFYMVGYLNGLASLKPVIDSGIKIESQATPHQNPVKTHKPNPESI